MLHQAGGAFGIQEQADSHAGGGFGRTHRVEGQPGAVVEVLARALIAVRLRRNQRQNAIRQSQSIGTDGAQQRVQRPPLFGAGDALGDLLAVAAQGVSVVQPAHHFGSGLGLIAVQQIDRDQYVFEHAHGIAHANVPGRELRQRLGAHVHQAVQLIHRVAAGIPEMGLRMGAALGPRIGVADE